MIKNLTQEQLANKSGIQRKYIIAYECDNNFPSLYNCNLIADTLQVDRDYLYDKYLSFISNNPGKNIRTIRNELNMTQKQFASLLNVATGTIKKWENNVAVINRMNFKQLIKIREGI